MEMPEMKESDSSADAASSSSDKQTVTHRSTLSKCVWAFILLGATVGFILHCTLVTQRYLQFSVYSASHISVNRKFSFPDVTVCPASFINLPKAQLDKGILHTNSANRAKLWMLNNVISVNLRQFWNAVLFQKPHKVGYSITVDPHDLTLNESLLQEYATYAASLSLAGSLGILNQPEDAILVCRYYGVVCDFRNFTPIVIGNSVCYIFQPDNEQLVSHDEDKQGLYLSIYRVMNSPPSSNVISSKDFDRVHVHPRNTWPSFTAYAGRLVPYTHLIYKIKQSEYWRMITPRSNCRSEAPMVKRCRLGRDAISSCTSYVHDETVCRHDNFQTDLYQSCGCISREWLVTPQLEQVHAPTCFDLPQAAIFNRGYQYNQTTGELLVRNLADTAWEDVNKVVIDIELVRRRAFCYWNFRQKILLSPQIETGFCPVPLCKQTSFTPISYRVASTIVDELGIRNFMEQTLKTTLIEINKNNLDNASIANLLRQASRNPAAYSMIVSAGGSSVTIKPSIDEDKHSADGGLGITITEEKLVSDLFKFLSDVGGVIGLWIGLSVMAVFDFVEMGIKHCYNRYKKPK